MNFHSKTYQVRDILNISIKSAPLEMLIQTIIVLIQSFLTTIGLTFATSYFVGAINLFFTGNYPRSKIYLPLIYLLLVILFSTILANIVQLLKLKIRLQLESKVLPSILKIRATLDFKHLENPKTWQLIERTSDGLVEIFLDTLSAYETIFKCVVSLSTMLILILTNAWWTLPLIVLALVGICLIALKTGKKMYYLQAKFYESELRYDYYTDILTSRDATEERALFGWSKFANDRYNKHFKISSELQISVSKKVRLLAKSFNVGLILFMSLLILPLLDSVLGGTLSPDLFMGLVVATFGLIATLTNNLQDAMEDLTRSREYIKDFTKLTNLSRNILHTELPAKKSEAVKKIAFKNVSFKYPNSENKVLEDLSFTLESGKHYALVGENSSGKTTIIKLLTGLYDNYEGEIYINEIELRSYSVSSLKTLFSVVHQDFSRYEITMLDNITLGHVGKKTDITSVKKIISKMSLETLVEKLTSGIQTPLGRLMKNSTELSGGQWQKIALARCLYSEASVKILDEPTAALDPIAESQVYKDFKINMKGITSLFISHRLASTIHADEILVLSQGRITEQGTHDSLISKNTLYKEMFDVQSRWYE